MSEWSTEAIIALVALFVTCIPVVFYLWRLAKQFTLTRAQRINQSHPDKSLHVGMFGGVDEELGRIPQPAQSRGPGLGDFSGTQASVWGE